ncbi:VRR-NUC domain-containing protein [Marinimicrobium sp. ABcell2]|uniref:VRR-NUC domain-containing protein n=1 Tax=Marinimicrobium sp. ABcell2 TaxID=3069751 RepID=UPI0027B7CD1D|nr:VRR-NUC domain-containing protein [Marinimicrobium sp. ABcell2]MDQ2077828.1 VRR-NUC domain-containing protein [Marinimicrobium sp. ABcell2]
MSKSPAFSENIRPASLDDPMYYLHNFQWVLDWVSDRHGDLLSSDEHQSVSQFKELPLASRGLMVRMVMRKGELFRADKLHYQELGCTRQAVEPLLALEWVSRESSLDLKALFRLFTWVEVRQLAPEATAGHRTKGQALETLLETSPSLVTPCPSPVYRLTIMALCDRFRLMFFGNGHQDWSEFVLSELGTYRYEQVLFTRESRPFHRREEVDTYLQLRACRERFYEEQPLNEVVASLPTIDSSNPWLCAARDRLVFKIAREYERAGELGDARALYQNCHYPGARARQLRVLERLGAWQEAFTLAQVAAQGPESEAEHQQVQRLLPRLRRNLGLAATPKISAMAPETFELQLPFAPVVELAVASHLGSDAAPVYYVENSLISGLFGLLFWDAIFAPIPGAFFHPFQRSPADLHWPDFRERRADLLEQGFEHLRRGTHGPIIRRRFADKHGLQCVFVWWEGLSEDLLNNALDIIPAEHLTLHFQRILRDIKSNTAGFPDLIQFWPDQKRYRMIEVKGPGDRLQDNQKRWLTYFAQHDIPASVCYVSWQSVNGASNRS